MAKDALAAREGDDAVHRQEVRRVFEALDQTEFVAQGPGNVVGQAFGIPRHRAFERQLLEGMLRGQTFDPDLVRILVCKFVEAEPATVGDFDAARHRFGP